MKEKSTNVRRRNRYPSFSLSPGNELSKVLQTVQLFSDDTNKCVILKQPTKNNILELPDILLKVLPPIDIRDIPIQVDKSSTNSQHQVTARLPTRYQCLPPYIRDQLRTMAITHALITRQSKLRGRIATVKGTPCPNWHVDKVNLRSLCALHGPGPVIRDQHILFDTGNMEIVSHDRENYADQGDMVFMRGIGQFANMPHLGTLHRSPFHTSAVPRLIVQVDCDDEGD